ncbi:MAG: hypothetical protein HFG37_01950 [Eubacterium sp.]|nr:hypothetical protein [Eubacterium sp.]
MKKGIMRKAAWAMAGALMFTSVLGSSVVSQAAPKTKKIVMNKKKVTLKVGKTFKLKVKKVNPTKASKAVTYKSNKTKIATVSKKGVIKAKKVGKAKITVVSKKNKKAKATVNVVVKKAASVKVPAVTTAPIVSATPAASAAPGTSAPPSVTQTPATSATPVPTSTPVTTKPPKTQPPKTTTPSPTPKYEKPDETAPPTNFVDLTSDDSYHNESPDGATVEKNEDGSLTITFTKQWAAINFYLPDNAQIYYSAYKSVALTYTSKGGNLGHALYDVDTIVGGSQAGDGEVGKHPDWGQKVVESEAESTLIFPVTSECAGGCIRGLQVFNPNETTADNPIEITIKAIVFSIKENPTLDDLKPPIKPSVDVSIESAPTEMAVTETSDITVAVKEGTIESVKWEVEGDAVTIEKDNEIKTVLTAVKAGEAKVSVTVTVKIGDKTETSTKTVTIQVNNPAKKE